MVALRRVFSLKTNAFPVCHGLLVSRVGVDVAAENRVLARSGFHTVDDWGPAGSIGGMLESRTRWNIHFYVSYFWEPPINVYGR